MMTPNDFCMLAVWGMGCPGFFGCQKIRGPTLTTVEAGLYRSSLEAPEAFQAEYEATEVDMGLSENSVPLNPMVNDHYPY